MIDLLEDLGVVKMTDGCPDPDFSTLVRSGTLVPFSERQRVLLGTAVELLAVTYSK
ncbi:hypothetical protein [Streptomyces albidoflavus]|uniref:hypothetical protein n=1 Tax=Streptomyces albidoflavus TaxID=1886 RepID=UPI002E3551A8|nr:hypothetical protein [Streptomyces albidoflavus]